LHTAYVIVTVINVVANAAVAAADLAGAGWVLANMTEVRVPRSWLRPLGLLKAAGAAGLLLGLLGVQALGIAAAIGLVLFFIGAITVHLRTRVLHNIGYPGLFFALAAASLALALSSR
jgi:hypothetical protein